MIRRSKSTDETEEIAPARRRGWAAIAGVLIFGLGAVALGGCGGKAASSSKRVARSVGFEAKIYDVAAGDGALWITSDGALLRVDPKTGSTVASIAVAGNSLFPIAAGPSAVWVGVLASDKSHGLLARIDPATNRVTARMSAPSFTRTVPSGRVTTHKASSEAAPWCPSIALRRRTA